MSRFTYDDLQNILRRNKSITAEGLVKARPRLPNPQPQHHPQATLERLAEGKEESLPRSGERVKIRITGYRVRPLDPDNFAGSTKDVIDALRAARLIEGDEWWRITLETEQEKVSSYKEEKTEILINP